MEAVVTVKMSPSELDTITAALVSYADSEGSRGNDPEEAPEDRRNAKQNVIRSLDVLDRLR